MEEENNSPGRNKLNQIQPISNKEELPKESPDMMPLSDLKLMQLKSKNQLLSSEELKFTTSPSRPRGKSQNSPKKKPGKTTSKKKNQRVSFNEQINKVHMVENWKTLNMDNSAAKNGSHCCSLM